MSIEDMYLGVCSLTVILLLPYTEWLQPPYNKSCLGFGVFLINFFKYVYEASCGWYKPRVEEGGPTVTEVDPLFGSS